MASLVSRVATPISDLTQSHRFWLRAALVAGMLLFVLAAGYLADATQLQLLLLLPAGLAGAAILWQWPPMGLVILTVVGMFTPEIGPQDLNLSIALVPLFWGVWLLKQLVSDEPFRLARSRTMWPLAGFIFASILAFIIGQLPWFNFASNAPMDAQVAGFVMFMAAAGAFLLAANQIKDLRWLQAMVWVFLLAGSVYVVLFVIPSLQEVVKGVYHSGIGGIFWAWLPPLLLAQGLANKKLPFVLRLLLIVLCALSIYAGIALRFDWKSGWIPSVIAVGAMIFFYSWRLALVLGLASLLPALALAPEVFSSDSYSLTTRLDAWVILLEILSASPLLGVGFSNYYWYTPLFRIRGFAVEFNSHNNFVDVAAQTGLFGLGCLLWLFWALFRLALRLRNAAPEGFARAYVYGAIGGLAGTMAAAMLGDWLLPFVYNVGLGGFRTGILAWLFLGALVALEEMYLRAPGAGDERPLSGG